MINNTQENKGKRYSLIVIGVGIITLLALTSKLMLDK
jgi:hypothetical protein